MPVLRFVAAADASTLEDYFCMDVDTSGYPDISDDLANKVRVGLAQAYGRNHIKTTDFVGTISRDIDILDDDPRVEGLPRVLSKESGGAYLADLPRPNESLSTVKGATYELRVAREKLIEGGEIPSSDTLKLEFKPDVHFDNLSESDYSAIAEKVYDNGNLTSVVKDDLQGQPEFDAFKMSTDGKDVYYEAKNRKDLSEETIEQQATRLFAYQLFQDRNEINDVRMVLFVSNGSEANDLEIGQEWLTVITYIIETPPGSSPTTLMWDDSSRMIQMGVES